MNWLHKRLYSTKEEQDTWSIDDWRYFWAQIMKILTEFVDTITEDRINLEKNEKKRRVLQWRLDKHIEAENDVKTWDLNKMSYNIQRLIKAQLLQSKRYDYAINNFDNLKLLDNLQISDEVLDLTYNGISNNPFEYYEKLNIKL